MNNISDKEAMREKFEKYAVEVLKLCIDEIALLDSDYREYAEPITQRHWKTWQAAYESCLNEFEQVAIKKFDGDCNGDIGDLNAAGYALEDGTPLFTRKG
jgi:hypothetical protein